MDWTNDSSIAALVEIGCNFVPSGRPAKVRELAAINRFLTAHGRCKDGAEALIRAGLMRGRPTPTLNSRLSYLRKHLSEPERHVFMRHMARLMMDIDGEDPRLQAFIHFAGVFLGLRESDMAQIRAQALSEPSPRVE